MDHISQLVDAAFDRIESMDTKGRRDEEFAAAFLNTLYNDGGPASCDNLLYRIGKEIPDDHTFFLQMYICMLASKHEVDEAMLRAEEIRETADLSHDVRTYEYVVACTRISQHIEDDAHAKMILGTARKHAWTIEGEIARLHAFLELSNAAGTIDEARQDRLVVADIVKQADQRGDITTVAHAWISFAACTCEQESFDNAVRCIRSVSDPNNRESLNAYFYEVLLDVEPKKAMSIAKRLPFPPERDRAIRLLVHRDPSKLLS